MKVVNRIISKGNLLSIKHLHERTEKNVKKCNLSQKI